MKKALNVILILVIINFLVTGVGYGAIYLFKMPVKSLPFVKQEELIYDPVEGISIASQWENVQIYAMKDRPDSVEEIIDTIEVDTKSDEEIYEYFELVDKESLKTYINAHSEVVENGYEKLFIDEADKLNKPIGVKTIYGDDVLALDAANGIMIVGVNITFGDNRQAQAKLAIVHNSSQVDMSVVEDLKYWDSVGEHVTNNQAILGINANGYVWNTTGKWASMFGLAKVHGNMLRKADNHEHTILFSKNGELSIGEDIDSAWNATEHSPILIKNAETVYNAEEDPEANIRMAQTAIGQTEDGKTLMLVVSGGIYGSGNGATYQEVLDIMNKYNAVNAAMLSGGSRSIMYWNGRVISSHDGYSEDGVLLPTSIIVRPNTGNKLFGTESAEETTENSTENKNQNNQFIPNPDESSSETNTESNENSDTSNEVDE